MSRWFSRLYSTITDKNWMPPTPGLEQSPNLAPAVPALPRRAPIVATLPDAAWTEAANAVGYAPPFLAEEEFKVKLARLGIETYNWAEVSGYMHAACEKLNAAEPMPRWASSGWTWGLTPLREVDWRAGGGSEATSFSRWYQHPVPMHALQLVKRVLDVAPDAYFAVTEIAKRPKADPFLIVTRKAGIGAAIHVIDQWDEPSFTGRATAVQA